MEKSKAQELMEEKRIIRERLAGIMLAGSIEDIAKYLSKEVQKLQDRYWEVKEELDKLEGAK